MAAILWAVQLSPFVCVHAFFLNFCVHLCVCVFVQIFQHLGVCLPHTQIQGCFRASAAVMRLLGLMVSILLIRSLASGVTVSHSGDGNCKKKKKKCVIYTAYIQIQNYRALRILYL